MKKFIAYIVCFALCLAAFPVAGLVEDAPPAEDVFPVVETLPVDEAPNDNGETPDAGIPAPEAFGYEPEPEPDVPGEAEVFIPVEFAEPGTLVIGGITLKDASTFIVSLDTLTTPLAGGTINASVSLNCMERCSSLGFTSFVIQENNGGWKTVASTYNRFTSNAYTYGITLSYSGAVAGRQYRCVANASATFNGTTETRYKESAGVYAK